MSKYAIIIGTFLLTALSVNAIKPPISLLETSAASAAHEIYQESYGNREAVEGVIRTLPLPEELKALLAKHWYLQYGCNENFILPELDYGFSIEELRAHDKLPAISHSILGPTLELCNLRIDDIEGIQHIPGIRDVQWLNLARNRIRTLRPGTFDAVADLKALTITRNLITEIPANAFFGLSNLRYLYLENNRITDIEEGAFQSLDQLTHLALEHNRIEYIKQKMFACLGSLSQLSLRNNQLTGIHLGAFNGLSSLDSLILSYNKNLSFLPEALKGAKKLQELGVSLDMQHNLIRDLTNYILSQTPQIRFSWIIRQ